MTDKEKIGFWMVLRGILISDVYFKDLSTGGKEQAVSAAIPRIEQAFEDAGWVQIPPLQAAKGYTITKGGTGTIIKPGEVMTGEAWYDRFIDAYNDAGVRKIVGDTYHDQAIDAAARKAAGME